MPSLKFTDTKGNDYGLDNLATASHVTFDNLFLRGTKIKKLPDNLTVLGTLDICETKLVELPSNLVVGDRLVLAGSLVRHLPDNLKAHYLDLRKSLVQSIGTNIYAGTIMAETSDFITEILRCDLFDFDPVGTKRELTSIFTLDNLEAEQVKIRPHRNLVVQGIKTNKLNIYMTYAQGNDIDLKIKRVQASVLNISTKLQALSKATTGLIGIDDALIGDLFVYPRANRPTSLTLKSNVSCDSMVIEDFGAKSDSYVSHLFRIQGARIKELVVKRTIAKYCQFSELVMDGNLFLAGDSNTLKRLLPEYGIIYGNVTVPIGFNLPENFSCLGELCYT